jgi:chemotaxis protein MotB
LAGKSAGRRGNGAGSTIIIRRDEGEEAGHHGGAWKVAYADFVTAMMAFFLLMWLLNATTEQQRTGLADYFAPTNLFGRSVSGSGKPFGGQTPNDRGTSVSSAGSPEVISGRNLPQQDVEEDDTVDTPAMPVARVADDDQQLGNPGAGEKLADTNSQGAQKGQDRHPLVKGGDYAAARLVPATAPADPNAPDAPAAATPTPGATAAAAAAAAAAKDDAQRERDALKQAGAQMLEAIQQDPTLQDVKGQIMVDSVPEGLRVQVVDAERRPMFALGSAAPTDRVRELMRKIVPALIGLPNDISIAGHTDALMYRNSDHDNWDLSSDRANATRRILTDTGFPENRIRSVTGNADRDLLVPANPDDPSNRRITIIVLRHAAAHPDAGSKS